jgi:integrase
MSRTLNRLSARFVATVAEAGRYSDGGNLYFSVSPNGGRRWVFLYRASGKPRELGLGSAREIPLARARERAAEMRTMLAEGIDPAKARQARTATPTFGEAADALIAGKEAGWAGRTINGWRWRLGEYTAAIRDIPVDAITTENVLSVLKPVWSVKPETATKLRGQIEAVLDGAKARGQRSGENPAAWKGNLAHLLPPARKLSRGHHPAMPYDDVPAFVARLRATPSTSFLALEFLILTAARSGEVMGATWPEIDIEAKLWTIPGKRMKARREHRVPLTDRSLDILTTMAPEPGDRVGHIFPGAMAGRPTMKGRAGDRPLSVMALNMAARRAGADGASPHGFRSSFRDWAGDRTSFSRELAEQALAHVVRDQTERAYRRGDALEKRRQMMIAWERFLEPSTGSTVVPLRRAAS